jgi:hypothetical protein
VDGQRHDGFPDRRREANHEARRRRGDPGGVEHEGYFPEDLEAIDFFAPVREDFLTGVPPSYMTGTAGNARGSKV